MVSVVEKLKELINDNGPKYLSEEPYKVYEELLRSGVTDRKTAGALLMLFAGGIPDHIKPENDSSFISKLIQRECCFNKKMADTLTDIVLSLRSRKNEAEWKKKEMAGLDEFRRETFSVKWSGFATWCAGGGGVDCVYNADIVLRPTKGLVIMDNLSGRLKKNPFLKTEDIRKSYAQDIKKHLDYEFENYCTCDDYYQPVVEDFELESYVEDWCKKNGFRMISCEGEGSDSGYEPDSVRRWIKYL